MKMKLGIDNKEELVYTNHITMIHNISVTELLKLEIKMKAAEYND